jgi:hypothetical protein
MGVKRLLHKSVRVATVGDSVRSQTIDANSGGRHSFRMFGSAFWAMSVSITSMWPSLQA